MQSSQQYKGNIAEQLAFEFLQGQGLTLIKRNYQCRLGEIDLIMQDSDTQVFVEVRHRAVSEYANGLESVDRFKQRKCIQAATHYLMENDLYDKIYCRFDVVAVAVLSNSPQIEWIQHAFEA